MLEATCPVANCDYRSIGQSVEEVLRDIKEHARIAHGIRNLEDKEIQVRTVSPEMTTGCM